MLKTNSKKAIENIRTYIVERFDPESYELEETNDFKEASKIIYNCFYDEVLKWDPYYKRGRVSEFEVFESWCQGLPSILDTCYYYNRYALDDLALILEETEEEKNRFTEEEAQKKLTYLIYRELKKGCK